MKKACTQPLSAKRNHKKAHHFNLGSGGEQGDFFFFFLSPGAG